MSWSMPCAAAFSRREKREVRREEMWVIRTMSGIGGLVEQEATFVVVVIPGRTPPCCGGTARGLGDSGDSGADGGGVERLPSSSLSWISVFLSVSGGRGVPVFGCGLSLCG